MSTATNLIDRDVVDHFTRTRDLSALADYMLSIEAPRLGRAEIWERIDGQWQACRICGETLPASSFHRDLKSKSGLKAECKSCRGAKPKVLPVIEQPTAAEFLHAWTLLNPRCAEIGDGEGLTLDQAMELARSFQCGPSKRRHRLRQARIDALIQEALALADLLHHAAGKAEYDDLLRRIEADPHGGYDTLAQKIMHERFEARAASEGRAIHKDVMPIITDAKARTIAKRERHLSRLSKSTLRDLELLDDYDD